MDPASIVVLVVILALAVFAGRRAFRVFFGKQDCCGGGCGGSCDTPKKKIKKVKVEDTDKANYPYHTVLSIGGMSCENCASNVENALNGVDGTWAKVDLVSRTADVLSKKPIDEPALERAVEDAGYRVVRI